MYRKQSESEIWKWIQTSYLKKKLTAFGGVSKVLIPAK
jgi:hypothetical protein